MAVVKNTFSATLDSITCGNYTLTGLTSETSTLNVTNVSTEVTKHFLQSLYQTLLDAGYTDAILDEGDYSITVLGFKFFILCRRYGNGYDFIPCIYVYGVNDCFSYWNNASGVYGINNYKTNEKELEYHITVRGDKNCVSIMYSSLFYPNNENPLIFIAKAKNLITSEDAFFYSSRMVTGTTGNYSMFFFRNKSDLYSNVSDSNGSHSFLTGTLNPSPQNQGLNTSAKYVTYPVLGYYGSYLVKSMITSNQKLFIGKKYYKIGSDIYYCHGFADGNSNAQACLGYPVLFKVSD